MEFIIDVTMWGSKYHWLFFFTGSLGQRPANKIFFPVYLMPLVYNYLICQKKNL